MTTGRAVAITGLGCISGLAPDRETFWDRLVSGGSGIGPVTTFDPAGFRSNLGCEVKERLTPEAGLDRVHVLALTAAREALAQAGGSLPRERTAVVMGTLMAGAQTLEAAVRAQHGSGRPLDLKAVMPVYRPAGIAQRLAQSFGLQGPVVTSGIACAASAAALAKAFDLIQTGVADAVVAGGADAFSFTTFAGFNALRSTAVEQCRPFSLGRDGLVIGEGAGILVLEAWDSAQRRRAKPLAFLRGVGLSNDAYHMTAPDPEGAGAVRAMRAALQIAELGPEAIEYVKAHGTGTPQNDRSETLALKTLLGHRAHQVPVSSIKAAIGHCMGASAGIETVAAVLAMERGRLPPTLHWRSGDPDCDLDYVPQQARPLRPRVVLCNAFGFAGSNAAWVLSTEPGSEANPHA